MIRHSILLLALLLAVPFIAMGGEVVKRGPAPKDNLTSDLTLNPATGNNNADVNNEFIGLFRIAPFSLGTMNDASETKGPYIDGDPDGEWSDTANITSSADNSIYRKSGGSLKVVVGASPSAGNGVTNPLDLGDESWAGEESFGLWMRCDTTTSAGDWYVEIDDDTASPDPTYDIPALSTANSWTWLEVDVTCTTTCPGDVNVITNLNIELSAAGATAMAGATCHFDYAFNWDAAEELAMSIDILEDGVIALYTIITATGQAKTPLVLTEGTDFFVHYETGNDFIVPITDQNTKSGWGLASLE